MANEIDLVVGQAAFDKIKELLLKLGEVDTKFGEIATKFSNLGSNINTIKSTADLAKLTAENAKLNAIIEQQIKDFADLNTKLAQATTARASNTKAITENTIAQREANKEATINATINNEQIGAYTRLDAQWRKAVKTAQDYAVSLGTQNVKYLEAKESANKLGQQLKAIDADLGKHTRNVGNYSSSWNGLGNSINQLTREAPAFANSVQTGFMALSNNIPILTDELGVLIAKNKALQAEGKPTESILKTVAGAFFSWQTAISLGVTILTVYGAKIWDSISGTKAKEEALKKETQALENKNKVESEANENLVRFQSDEISKSKLLFENAKNISLSYSERSKAINDLRERYPDYLKGLSDEKLLAGDTATAENELSNALLKRGIALAAAEEIQKIISKNLINEKKHSDDLLKIEKERSKVAVTAIDPFTKNKKEQQILEERSKILSHIFYAEKSINEEYEIKKANNKSELDFYLKQYEENVKFISVVKEVNKASSGKDKTEDVERKAIKSVNELQKVDTLLGRINTEIERLKVEKIVANAEELPAVNFQLEMLYKLRSQLNGLPVGGALPDNFVKPEQIEGVKELTKEMQNYLNSFGAEFASKAGLSETFNMLSGNIEGFGTNAKTTFVAVAESAQEMFNIIAEASQANFDQEYARLDKQKETSLKFAGDSTAAKEKIDADYEKKKKEIQLREFKAKQKITLANIAIDTAQAIVSTWAQVPKYDFGISATALSVMIGAMGAVQAGMVLAQKPPAYAEGTDNHQGGLMLVNDGKGDNYQEKVILPSGKVIRPQGRNVLMNAPKGTKVLNHEQQLFEMLQSNNISFLPQQSGGMTSEEMDEILGKHFGNIKTQNTIFDKNGFQTYIKNGNSITRSNSNRSQGIGISV